MALSAFGLAIAMLCLTLWSYLPMLELGDADFRWKMAYARDSTSYYDGIGRQLEAQLAAAGAAAE